MKKRKEDKPVSFNMGDRVQFIDGSIGKIIEILDKTKALIKFEGDPIEYVINFESLNKL